MIISKTELTNIIAQVIEEAKIPAESKRYLKRKGAKSTVDPKEATRVEAKVSNKEMPGNLGSAIGSMAAAMTKMAKLKAEVDKMKDEFQPAILEKADELFEESDKLITRVIQTAGYIVTIDKATETHKFNKKKFIEMVQTQLTDQQDLILSLVEAAHDIVTKSPSLTITDLNEESRVLDKVKALVTSGWHKFISGVKNKIARIGVRQKELAEQLKESISVRIVRNIDQYSSKLAEFVLDGHMTSEAALNAIKKRANQSA